ncbi:ATPase domain-containing protein [Tundrisphaera lichenicola]|uniref:ATPase domain-containing protein n=1 Tax=Tundrisphaera lichenicola TaxID=2029860 RepID=UPI003EB75C71
MASDPQDRARIDESVGLASTGNLELDAILAGGLPAYHVYLIEGDPGAGKTTLALQFLLEGARLGERGMYVTLSETEGELRIIADSHGWSLDAIDIFELNPSLESLERDSHYTMFHPSEVELSETTKAILSMVEKNNPKRVVFDSLSEMRLLAQDPLRYRRQIMALKRFFLGRRSTVLFLDDRTSGEDELNLQSIVHGVINLEQRSPEFGAERRRMRVIKMRGVKFRGGYHDFRIERGGLDVYPRLTASEHRQDFDRGRLLSDLPELDKLLGGGVDYGSSTLIAGPAGVGKSTLATRYVFAAAERGQRCAMFIFDETLHTLLDRAESMGMNMRKHVESGLVTVQQVDPAELSPMEFAVVVSRMVRPVGGEGARIVVIDSLNGYLNAMPEERFLVIQLHEILVYLGQLGVVTFLIVAQHGLLGPLQSPVDASYLADTVILLRYYENHGRIRKAISVLKKRTGIHEETIRELRLSADGLVVGEPLETFRGIMSSSPSILEPLRPMESGHA